MTVRVRMFAAVREAAGTGETTVAPGPLNATLDTLRERYGPVFAQRLAISTVLVDGEALRHDADRMLPDGCELAVLPPVSGGGDPDPRPVPAAGLISSVVLAAVVLGALLAGPAAFHATVTVLAALLVLDLSGVLARAGARPVVVAALLPGAGLPAATGFWPGAGWEHIPGFFVAALAAAFVLVIAFGRRSGVTAGIGATLVVSAVVGLGSAGVVLLSRLTDGGRWALGFLVIAAAADVGTSLGHRVFHGATPPRPLPGAPALIGGVGGVAVAAGAVGAALRPPFTLLSTTLIAGVGLVAALGVRDFARALAAEAGLDRRPRVRPLGHGLLIGPAGAALVAAPAAYVLARGVAL